MTRQNMKEESLNTMSKTQCQCIHLEITFKETARATFRNIIEDKMIREKYQVILKYNPKGDHFVEGMPFSIKVDSDNGTGLRLEYHKEMLEKAEEGIRKQIKEYPDNPQKWIAGSVYNRASSFPECNSQFRLANQYQNN